MVTILTVSLSLSLHTQYREGYPDYEFNHFDDLNLNSANFSGNTEMVSNSTINNCLHPAIAIDTLDNVYITWYNWSDTDSSYLLYYRFKNSTTQVWSDIEILSESGLDPDIEVDQFGNVFISYTYYQMIAPKEIHLTYWNRTLKTWVDEGKISTTEEDDRSSLAIDNNGNLNFIWRSKNSTDYYNIFYRYFNSTSIIWSTTELVSLETTNDSYAAVLSIDNNNNVHVSWEDKSSYLDAGTESDIFYKYRNSTTKTWSTAELVSENLTSGMRNPTICVDSLQNVHISWVISSFSNEIYYRAKNGSNGNWKSIKILTRNNPPYLGDPHIKADQQDNIHVIWNAYFGGDDVHHTYYTRLDSTLQNWTMISKIAPDSVYESNVGDMVVNASGNLFITWLRDSEVYFTKTSSAVPESFTLLSDADQPDLDKSFELSWDDSNNAEYYEIYYDTSEIQNLEDATLLEDVYLDTTYSVELENSGTYHYLVVAHNLFGNISSNSVEVIAQDPPGSFTLSYSLEIGDPHSINLTWTESNFANNYSIYFATNYMLDFTQGTNIVFQIDSLNYIYNVSADGTYYFIIVAHNNFANTTSNSIEIQIDTPGGGEPSPEIPGFDIIILLSISAIATGFIIKKKIK
ncbi:MAG: hypothetical protein GF317_03785 [Candidatus Lokiarchaeota archaeon]|nr:hypothetical protein [Candidatus Lokiarchaeota archaeon]MBD3199009.1 hypothetical protein [Candidatus Lokiarchaeota archaeon]